MDQEGGGILYSLANRTLAVDGWVGTARRAHNRLKMILTYLLVWGYRSFICNGIQYKSSASAEVADRNVTWYVL